MPAPALLAPRRKSHPRGLAAQPGRLPALPFERSAETNGRDLLGLGRAGIGAGALLMPGETSPVLNAGGRGGCGSGGGNGQSFPRSGAACEVKVHQRREN